MATSSITKNVYLKTKEEIEQFVEALEKAEQSANEALVVKQPQHIK